VITVDFTKVRHEAGGLVRALFFATVAVAAGATLPAAAAPMAPLLGGAPQARRLVEPEPPLRIAQGHIRKAKEYLGASCEMLKSCDRHAVDGYYVACQEAWNAAWTCPESPDILCEAADLYADALAGLLEAARRHDRMTPEGLWVGPRGRPVLVPFRPQALNLGTTGIASVEPQGQPDDHRIHRRHLRDGFGLPVVVRVTDPSRACEPAAHDEPSDQMGRGGQMDKARLIARMDQMLNAPRTFAARRQSLAATAVLRFDVPGNENFLEKFAGPAARDHAAAVLDLANPVEIAAVRIGSAKPHLAADLSAPLLDVLEGTPQTGITGFLVPFGSGATRPHLEMLEPHQPGRIPVVFIHGLASDQGTWFDMINELRAWPEFHRRFEPWVYRYPTGAAFLNSSAVLRHQLTEAVRQCDPEGRDPALKNIVLVGHSMGGLHAKLQVVEPGTRLWEAVGRIPFEEIQLRPELKRFAARGYFFHPLPFVNRIVCIATPHKGSLWASVGAGRLASLTVRPPPESRLIHDEAVQRNPGAFYPEYERRTPTTIDILQPDSRLLQALEGLRPPCWVTVHSIVADGHVSITGERDDCVVSVESAHTQGAVSEICVPSTHTKVNHHPATIAEVKRILAQHLREIPR
jgi:hypothetical protein